MSADSANSPTNRSNLASALNLSRSLPTNTKGDWTLLNKIFQIFPSAMLFEYLRIDKTKLNEEIIDVWMLISCGRAIMTDMPGY